MKTAFVCAAVASLLVCGCQHGDGFSPDAPALLNAPTSSEAEAASPPNIDALVKSYYATTAPAADEQRKQIRNQIVRGTMRVIDARFNAFDEDLWRNRNLSDFAFDLTNIALGFTGTIVGGTETKTVTNALVTVVTGTKTSINSDFYNKETALAISAKMRALRSAQGPAILNRLEKEDVEAYPLAPDALEDLARYYRDGTVLGALQDITENSTKTAKDNNAKVAATSAYDAARGARAATPSTNAAGGRARTPLLNLLRDTSGQLRLFDAGMTKEYKIGTAGVPELPAETLPPAGRE